MNKLTKIAFFPFLLIILSGCGRISLLANNLENEALTTEATPETTVESPATLEHAPAEQEVSLPATFDLDVAFASQAPFGNWELPYQEACEEASLITAYKYFAKQPLDAAIMDEELKKLVAWETTNLGLYTDTNVAEVARMAKEYFKLDVEISSDVSEQRIKEELVKGHLIILPASGRDLDNPNFTAPGPLFHMLVVRGYDRNEFITNDPGTRKGLKFKYKYDNLLSAVHDLYSENGIVFRPYEETETPDAEKSRKMRLGDRKMMIVKGL
ncbi:MAG TPA: C39 family peptidase [Candidatus Bipolaricaulota bacterium]|nr:C39 family peptidase [Candidatus Bipolaricaulota bacterium]